MQRRSTLYPLIGTLVLGLAILLTGSVGLAPADPIPDPLQERGGRGDIEILSSQIEISTDRARLQLELADGNYLEFSVHDGQVWEGALSLGPAPRGEALDRAWRELLSEAIDTPTEELADLLMSWSPPGTTGVGSALADRLELGLMSAGHGRGISSVDDTIAKLRDRIAELEGKLSSATTSTADKSRDRASRTRDHTARSDSGRVWYQPLIYIGGGLVGLLGNLILLVVLIGIGFVVVYFSRRPLETIADTVRNEPLRSGAVGLAASFLLLPGWVIVIIALIVSIVGIPLVLLWLPLFWIAVSLAAILGYLAVGHGLGEAFAERRLYGGEPARYTNSYYYLMTGLTILFVPFLVVNVVDMAGPWLSLISKLVTFLGATLTWIAFTIGFGAVLLTRAGTRPRPATSSNDPEIDMSDLFEEASFGGGSGGGSDG